MRDVDEVVEELERPDHGDDSRTYGPFIGDESLYFARVNRGKESITLDLRAAEDLDVLHAMLQRADHQAARRAAVEELSSRYGIRWADAADPLTLRGQSL